ncbi:MAG: hypothetical protein M0R37_05545 [Bacteroidales bacterium]|nr:hypothetical protein [Bacteroidales bacterium]
MENAKNKYNFGLIILLIVVLSSVILYQQGAFKKPSFETQMAKAAKKLNKQCPKMIDSETQLDSAVVFRDSLFQYNYTMVKMVRDSIDTLGFRHYMKPKLLKFVRYNNELKPYRDHRIIMEYLYRDKRGSLLGKFTFTPKKYLEEDFYRTSPF